MSTDSTVNAEARRSIEKELLALLKQGDSILCVSHVNPDGDALGSLLGMGWMLRAIGKDPVMALQDRPPKSFSYIPGFDEIVGVDAISADYDLIVCLDASSPDRMGQIYRQADHGDIPLVVIDHHITNTYFGTYNWVIPDCAATCQMLVYLADALEVPLEGPLVTALLTGVVTDTLCFRTTNTDADVLQVAMRLVDAGGDLNYIVQQTLQRQSYSMVKLWGGILPNISLEDGVIWALIRNAQRKTAGVSADETGGLANYLVTVDEADISATFTERQNEAGEPVVECSFRSKPGFDVSKVAFAFGGGGHPAAAGCTLAGTIDNVPERVVKALQAARREQLEASVKKESVPSV